MTADAIHGKKLLGFCRARMRKRWTYTGARVSPIQRVAHNWRAASRQMVRRGRPDQGPDRARAAAHWRPRRHGAAGDKDSHSRESFWMRFSLDFTSSVASAI